MTNNSPMSRTRPDRVALCTRNLWELEGGCDFTFQFPGEGKTLSFNRAAMAGSLWFRQAESFFNTSKRDGRFEVLVFDERDLISHAVMEVVLHLRYGMVTLRELVSNKEFSFSDLYHACDFLMDRGLKESILEEIRRADNYERTIELLCCAFDLSRDETDHAAADYCMGWLVEMDEVHPLQSCDEYVEWCCGLDPPQLKKVIELYKSKVKKDK